MREIVKKIATPSSPLAFRITVGEAVERVLSGLSGRQATRRPAVLVVDRTVAELHCERLRRLSAALAQPPTHVVAPGESSKSLEGLAAVHESFAAAGLDRGGMVVAVGGGVTGDLAGFAAATWMRGVPWVTVPTTLEAAVDAAIGGKTAINHPAGKNLVGAFHQPECVVIDLRFLDTLPEREFRAGLAESLKHALIADAPFLDWQESKLPAVLARDAATLESLIARNCEIKADIVCEDEREQRGRREALNFGHTVGHALEAAFDYHLRHGECVAVGLVAACELSVSRGLIARDVIGRVRAWLTIAGLPRTITEARAAAGSAHSNLRQPADDELMALIGRDKKQRAGVRRLVLLCDIGQCFVADDVSDDELRRALQAIR